MTLFNSLSNFFCKKRKSSKGSHAPSPAKTSSKSTNSSNEDDRKTSRPSQPDQQDSDDDLRESIRTQKIIQSEYEEDVSEMEQSQRSFHLNGEISAAVASSSQKKGNVDLSRGDKHEKTGLYQPRRVVPSLETNSFPQGEGSQARIRRTPNTQEIQRERVQERTEQESLRPRSNRIPIEIGTTSTVEAENESLFSSEVSCQSGTEEERKRERALEDLERFNFTRIRFRKDKEMHEVDKKNQGKKYLAFCKDAGVNAYEFYKEFTEKNKESVEKENLEERIKTLLEMDGFPTDKLRFTEQNLPHKTYTSQDIKEWLYKYGYYDKL